MTTLSVTAPKLGNWGWQDIVRVYKVYGQMLKQHNTYKKRCHIPTTIDIKYPDSANLFIMRFNRDVRKIDLLVSELDKEIARRNDLIGVVG